MPEKDKSEPQEERGHLIGNAREIGPDAPDVQGAGGNFVGNGRPADPEKRPLVDTAIKTEPTAQIHGGGVIIGGG